MLTFQTFSSSSAGNAALLSWNDVHILVDLGISCRRAKQELAARGLAFEDLAAICVTHEHSDHVSGLRTYVQKQRTPLLCSKGTARQLAYQFAGIEPMLAPFDGETACRGIVLRGVALSHDVSQGTGFRFDTPEGSVGILTDTGVVTQEAEALLPGVDLLVLEANHDVERLKAGSRPYHIKRRVLGPSGHLSNDAAADFACLAADRGTSQILLAHISADNNDPALALGTVGRALSALGWQGALSAAPQLEAGPVLEVRVCSRSS